MTASGCSPAMDMFRSEQMQLVQLIIPVESAHRAISYLGDLGLFQFKDLNAEKSPFQRTYAAQIKRCAEIARKLRFFRDQMEKTGLLTSSRSFMGSNVNLEELEVKLGEYESELLEMNGNSEKLQRSYNEFIEYKLVLQKASEILRSADRSVTAERIGVEAEVLGDRSIESPLLLEQKMLTDPLKHVKFGFVSGLVSRDKSLAFERMLFRSTRGNVFHKQVVVEEPVVDPVSGDKVEKSVFVVFYSGERAKNKILKICDAFGANCYPSTDDIDKQHQLVTEVSGKLLELKTTIDMGKLHRTNLLQSVSYEFEHWNLLVKREKSIYHIFNRLSHDVTKKCFVGEGWCPVSVSNQIQNVLNQATMIAIHKSELYSRCCRPRIRLQHTSVLTNLLQLFRKSLMRMGSPSIRKQIPRFLLLSPSRSYLLSCSETGAMGSACFLQHCISYLGRRNFPDRSLVTSWRWHLVLAML